MGWGVPCFSDGFVNSRMDGRLRWLPPGGGRRRAAVVTTACLSTGVSASHSSRQKGSLCHESL